MSDPQNRSKRWRPPYRNPNPDFACRECGVEFYASRMVTLQSDGEYQPIWECPNCGSSDLERLR